MTTSLMNVVHYVNNFYKTMVKNKFDKKSACGIIFLMGTYCHKRDRWKYKVDFTQKIFMRIVVNVLNCRAITFLRFSFICILSHGSVKDLQNLLQTVLHRYMLIGLPLVL